MSEKFTPGPWYLEFDNCDEEGFLEEAEFTGAIVGADGEGILQVYSKANAHLASAAPEMYEIITALLEYIDAIPPEVVASLPTMPGVSRDWIESVMAKARGES